MLVLFDGLGTTLMALKELELEVELYVSSEVCVDAVKYSTSITPRPSTLVILP